MKIHNNQTQGWQKGVFLFAFTAIKVVKKREANLNQGSIYHSSAKPTRENLFFGM